MSGKHRWRSGSWQCRGLCRHHGKAEATLRIRGSAAVTLVQEQPDVGRRGDPDLPPPLLQTPLRTDGSELAMETTFRRVRWFPVLQVEPLPSPPFLHLLAKRSRPVSIFGYITFLLLHFLGYFEAKTLISGWSLKESGLREPAECLLDQASPAPPGEQTNAGGALIHRCCLRK